ncbi:hypothetical protein Q3G72_026931 [Acer saccharum]|nr:hypothetical protein Q3G72_026931 [Acer saccharum]
MAFSAILRKSASSLALTASRLTKANRNYHSAVSSASSHLNRKPTLGSFVPDFEFSSATETKKCSSNIESLLQLAIDSEIMFLDDHDSVEEPPSEFTLKIEDTHRNEHTTKYDVVLAREYWGELHTTKYHVVLTREYRGELVEISSHISDHLIGKDGMSLDLHVTIKNHGGSSLKFGCRGTSDAISIWKMNIINSEILKDSTEFSTDEQFQIRVICNDIDENLNEAFLEYLEIRGIKPSIVDFLIKGSANGKQNGLILRKNVQREVGGGRVPIGIANQRRSSFVEDGLDDSNHRAEVAPRLDVLAGQKDRIFENLFDKSQHVGDRELTVCSPVKQSKFKNVLLKKVRDGLGKRVAVTNGKGWKIKGNGRWVRKVKLKYAPTQNGKLTIEKSGVGNSTGGDVNSSSSSSVGLKGA